jgi:hypothetical protein
VSNETREQKLAILRNGLARCEREASDLRAAIRDLGGESLDVPVGIARVIEAACDWARTEADRELPKRAELELLEALEALNLL